MRGYLRYPHLAGDLMTFVADDAIWLAPVSGGRAWRLSGESTPARFPRFNPDGTFIAWTSVRGTKQEVMLTDVVHDADTRQLTWWGAETRVLGWTGDGRILVASNAGEDAITSMTVRALSLDGTVEQLPYGPASGIAIHDDGAVVTSTVYRRPPEYWKRYRGGTAPRLWIDRIGDGSWEHILGEEHAGMIAPMWLGDTLVFASDREATIPGNVHGQSNLWAIDDLATGEPRRLTHHDADDGYVRDPSTDRQRISYHCRGELFVLDALDSAPRRVDITLPGELVGRRRRLLQPTESLSALLPDRQANGSVVSWRGTAFYLTHRDGPARAIAADSGVRVREATLLGNTGLVVMASDRLGEDGLEIRPLTGDDPPRTLAQGTLGRVLSLASDPAGAVAAVASHDGRISLVDVASGDVADVAHSRQGEAESLGFSPDGRFLVWSEPVSPGGRHRLMAAAVDRTLDDAGPWPLTTGRFNDFSPAFTLDGQHLVFLSARTFDPRYDAHSFDLSFPAAIRPYLVPLGARTPPPVGPSADGWPLAPVASSAAETTVEPAGEPGTAVVSTDFDHDGFEDRLVAFPVPSATYRDLRPVKDGVTWVRDDTHGELGDGTAGVEKKPADALEYFSFAKRTVEVLVDSVSTHQISGDGERVVVRQQKKVTVRPVDHPVKDDDPACVTVDLDRLKFTLDPVAQWRQMFEENARLMRDHYWRADMNGVDWDAAVARYRPVLDRLACSDDLVDLLWETVGELNTSHAYVTPPTPPGAKPLVQGLLGADLEPAADGWRITRILPSESSNPKARSPLRAAGVSAEVGDVIVAVAGQPVDPRRGPGPLLVGTANQPVELTLATAGGERRRVAVVPLDDEEHVRYQAWVTGRSAYVAEHSGGRLGYVHVPDMMSRGWAQLHRDISVATRAEGLVVDVRFNRGGHISQLVIERIARSVVGYMTIRHMAGPYPYPEDAPRGPVVLVANEWAGSDGDIVNAVAQITGVGPVIGVRTWGGVVGIDGRFDLVDGTAVTQPRYASWFAGVGWGVENHGVDPDIEVERTPADYAAGADPQLDAAIAEALARLTQTPAVEPPPLPPPVFG